MLATLIVIYIDMLKIAFLTKYLIFKSGQKYKRIQNIIEIIRENYENFILEIEEKLWNFRNL